MNNAYPLTVLSAFCRKIADIKIHEHIYWQLQFSAEVSSSSREWEYSAAPAPNHLTTSYQKPYIQRRTNNAMPEGKPATRKGTVPCSKCWSVGGITEY